jgi:hypothetical protein
MGSTSDPRQKKIVRYHELRACKVGDRAVVRPIDHPDIPMGATGRTTVVLSFDATTGIAETSHTRYVPGPFADWSETAEGLPGFTFGMTVPSSQI